MLLIWKFALVFAFGGALSPVSAALEDPESFDAGLPDVDDVFASAKDTMQEFTVQAELMKDQVARREEAENTKLLAQKANYEKELLAQKHDIATMETGNDALRGVLKSLDRGNRLLRDDAGRMRESNQLMRLAMISLGPKMKTAKQFLIDATKVAEEQAKAMELQVLEPKAPEPTLEHFLSVAQSSGMPRTTQQAQRPNATAPATLKPTVEAARLGGKPLPTTATEAANHPASLPAASHPTAAHAAPAKADKPAVSLFEVGSGLVGTLQGGETPYMAGGDADYTPSVSYTANKAHSSPEALIEALPKRLQDLSRAQKEGEVQLQAHFMALKEVGDTKKAELAAAAKDLEARRSALVNEQINLHAAKQQLITLGKDLQERLRGLRLFAQKAGESVTDAITAADAAADDAV